MGEIWMTDNATKKKYVEVGVYNTGEDITYEGRLLGLINDKEYAAIIEKSDIRNKLLCVATTPVKDIGTIDNIAGFRLALAVKKRGVENVINRTLFITEPLEYASAYDLVENEVSFVGSEGSYITVKEV
jgi:hypothetical protein